MGRSRKASDSGGGFKALDSSWKIFQTSPPVGLLAPPSACPDNLRGLSPDLPVYHYRNINMQSGGCVVPDCIVQQLFGVSDLTPLVSAAPQDKELEIFSHNEVDVKQQDNCRGTPLFSQSLCKFQGNTKTVLIPNAVGGSQNFSREFMIGQSASLDPIPDDSRFNFVGSSTLSPLSQLPSIYESSETNTMQCLKTRLLLDELSHRGEEPFSRVEMENIEVDVIRNYCCNHFAKFCLD